MLDIRITPQDLREILAFVAARIEEQESSLNALDSAIGDADHGITMRIGFRAVSRRLKELDGQANLETIFREAGMAFMSVAGGAIGVILGKMLVGAGTSLRGKNEIGVPEVELFMNSMEEAIVRTGKAKPGDKTVLDAVHAACQSLRLSSDSSHDLVKLLGAAALAAETAAQATAGMVCRVGRASRLGDRTLGHPDPGAVSFSIILRAMTDWLVERHRSVPFASGHAVC